MTSHRPVRLDSRTDSYFGCVSWAHAACGAIAVIVFTTVSANAAPMQPGDMLIGSSEFLGSGSTFTARATRTGSLSLAESPTARVPELRGPVLDKNGRIVGVSLQVASDEIIASDSDTGLVEVLATLGPDYRVASTGLGTPLLVLENGAILVLARNSSSSQAELLRLSTTGELTALATVPAFTGSIALDVDGSVLVVSDGDLRIFRVDLQAGAAATVANDIPVVGVAVGIAISPLDGTIYVAASQGGGVFAVDPATGTSSLIPGTDITLGVLGGVAIDSQFFARLVVTRLVDASGESPVISVDLETGGIEPFAVTGEVTDGLPASLFVVQAECNDRFDNDNDGLVDLEDPSCGGQPTTHSEAGCGSGFDQAIALFAPLLWVVRRRLAREDARESRLE